MRTILATLGASLISTVVVSSAYAGAPTPLGVALPFDEGGLVGLVAAAVIAGAFIARRKR
jgi:hypothetical protein